MSQLAAVATSERAERAADDPADVVVGWLTHGGADDLAAQTASWGPGEWARAREATLVHGVAPLLAARLVGSAAWAALDPLLREYCAEQRETNGRRQQRMLAELAEIRRAAAAAGVAVLPLKGAVLATHYYPDPALRPMADLDLLVRPADLARFDAVLAQLGYRMRQETPRHLVYLRGPFQVARRDGEHPDNPRCVEVHTAIEERMRGMLFTITGAFWESPIQAGDGSGLLPAPAALLQHLLLHGSHNMTVRRLRLIQLYDIALVAPQVGAADWLRAAEAALGYGEARLLYPPLALAERLFGPLAPATVRDRLAAGTPPVLRQLVANASPSDFSLCNRHEASPAYKLAWYQPGPQLLGAMFRVAWPAPEDLYQRYPAYSGRPMAGYLRHLAHVGGWSLRLLLRRPRRTTPRVR